MRDCAITKSLYDVLAYIFNLYIRAAQSWHNMMNVLQNCLKSLHSTKKFYLTYLSKTMSIILNLFLLSSNFLSLLHGVPVCV